MTLGMPLTASETTEQIVAAAKAAGVTVTVIEHPKGGGGDRAASRRPEAEDLARAGEHAPRDPGSGTGGSRSSGA